MKVYIRFMDTKTKDSWLYNIVSLRVQIQERKSSPEYGDYEVFRIQATNNEGLYIEHDNICDLEVY